VPEAFQKTLKFGIEVFSKMDLVDHAQYGVDARSDNVKRFVLCVRLVPQSGLAIGIQLQK
jgi:hypothetical protein